MLIGKHFLLFTTPFLLQVILGVLICGNAEREHGQRKFGNPCVRETH